MKYCLLIASFLCFSLSVIAQKVAITEHGEEVLLYDDGTWKLKEGPYKETEISLNDTLFVKDPTATFLVRSKHIDVGVWITPKKWTFSTKGDNDDVEYFFRKKQSDLYGMLITEKIEAPVLTLKELAVSNAQEVSPDLRVVKEEFRTVNGKQVLMMQMSGTIQGIRISYFGYYYSSKKGSVQFVIYTGQSLFDENRADIEVLLNGLVELQ